MSNLKKYLEYLHTKTINKVIIKKNDSYLKYIYKLYF